MIGNPAMLANLGRSFEYVWTLSLHLAPQVRFASQKSSSTSRGVGGEGRGLTSSPAAHADSPADLARLDESLGPPTD
jgi:hypothetical protein